MTNKKCTKCNTTRSVNQFYKNKISKDGYGYYCKPCIKVQGQEYYQNNKDKIKNRNLKWKQENPEKYKEMFRLREQRRRSDPIKKSAIQIRCRILQALKKLNSTKQTKTEAIVGCTKKELWNHLCNTFEANYGIPREWLNSFKYEIDHIIPISTAKSEEEVYKLNHYTNLQILLKEDNRDKSDKEGWELL